MTKVYSKLTFKENTNVSYLVLFFFQLDPCSEQMNLAFKSWLSAAQGIWCLQYKKHHVICK